MAWNKHNDGFSDEMTGQRTHPNQQPNHAIKRTPMAAPCDTRASNFHLLLRMCVIFFCWFRKLNLSLLDILKKKKKKMDETNGWEALRSERAFGGGFVSEELSPKPVDWGRQRQEILSGVAVLGRRGVRRPSPELPSSWTFSQLFGGFGPV